MSPHELEELLAQSALHSLERENKVYDAIGKLVDNVIDLKRENRALLMLVEKQHELLQNLAVNVVRNQQILSNQQEQMNQIGSQVAEQKELTSSWMPQLVEGQTKLYPQILEGYDKLSEDVKDQKLLLAEQNERFSHIEELLSK